MKLAQMLRNGKKVNALEWVGQVVVVDMPAAGQKLPIGHAVMELLLAGQ